MHLNENLSGLAINWSVNFQNDNVYSKLIKSLFTLNSCNNIVMYAIEIW